MEFHMIPKNKICPKCQINKSSTEYHLRKDKGYTYLKSYCKSCSHVSNMNNQYDICECGKKKTKKSTHCQACANNKQQKYETLADIMHYRGKYGQSAAFNIVRGRARNCLKYSKCEKCGYDKHVEACHIKPISSFTEDTLIDTINHPDNLIALCPNCHWEFDNLREE